MKTYSVVWVNIMSVGGNPRHSKVEAESHAAGDLVRAIEQKHHLLPGAVQLLEARQL